MKLTLDEVEILTVKQANMRATVLCEKLLSSLPHRSDLREQVTFCAAWLKESTEIMSQTPELGE